MDPRSEKLLVASCALAAAAIPLAIGLVGHWYSQALKERELQGKFVELAIGVLREKPAAATAKLRGWSADVIDKYSGVPLGKAKKSLIKNISLPIDAPVLRNQLGANAFYSRNFGLAASHFADALRAKPGDDDITINLADSYVELGAFDKAIALYQLYGGSPHKRDLSLGMATLRAGRFADSINYLRGVPDDFAKDLEDQKGIARVLEAAALVGIANREKDAAKKTDLLRKAKEKWAEGLKQSPMYWKSILTGVVQSKHVDYQYLIGMLDPIVGPDY